MLWEGTALALSMEGLDRQLPCQPWLPAIHGLKILPARGLASLCNHLHRPVPWGLFLFTPWSFAFGGVL